MSHVLDHARARQRRRADTPDGAGFAGSKRLAKRAHDLLQKAHAAGVRSGIGDGSLNADGSGVTLTIITAIKPMDGIFHEEIFSSAAIPTVVKDEAEAILFTNGTLHSLNGSVHSRDILAAIRVAKQMEARRVHIGNLAEFDEQNIPFGRTEYSDPGSNNGKYAVNEFLVDKTIRILDSAAGDVQFGI
ncbi:aldehyde dehydrogenase family domain-containing protein [Trichoderma austrokoningii]